MRRARELYVFWQAACGRPRGQPPLPPLSCKARARLELIVQARADEVGRAGTFMQSARLCSPLGYAVREVSARMNASVRTFGWSARSRRVSALTEAKTL